MNRSPIAATAAAALTAALSLGVGAAHAQSVQSASGERGYATCADYDLDGDGVVSAREVRDARDAIYLDAAVETQAELYGTGSPALMLAMFDLDGDGRVSRTEFVDGPSTCTR